MFKNFTKYEVYEDGRIWSYKTNRFIKPFTNKKGYQSVNLYNNEGKMKTYRLNRVIYESVTGEPIPSGLEVNHLDENKTNNHISNLNLMTHKENVNWGTCIERCSKSLTNGKLSKAVGAYKDGKLVMSFPSTREAERNGFYSSSVSDCCRGKIKTHKGFEWIYL